MSVLSNAKCWKKQWSHKKALYRRQRAKCGDAGIWTRVRKIPYKPFCTRWEDIWYHVARHIFAPNPHGHSLAWDGLSSIFLIHQHPSLVIHHDHRTKERNDQIVRRQKVFCLLFMQKQMLTVFGRLSPQQLRERKLSNLQLQSQMS